MRLDHAWYEHQTLSRATGLHLPEGKRVALIVTVPMEFFPLDSPEKPFRPSGALDRPYPDTWGYANRDYGNRVGIHRLLRVFDKAGIRATAFVDAATAIRYPYAMAQMAERGWELAASGVDRSSLHSAGVGRAIEAANIADAIGAVSAVSALPVIGWQSPGQSESFDTLELLATAGLRYVADWVNDELPYVVKTVAGNLVAMPTSFELSDRNILVHHDFTVDDYVQQVLAAAARLDEEATASAPRVLPLTITPWVSGYPHRVRALTEMLLELLENEAIWPATCAELLAVFQPELA
jgi:allantoinase